MIQYLIIPDILSDRLGFFYGKHDKYYNVYNFEEEQTIELESRIEQLYQVTLNKSSTILVPLNVS